MADSKKGLYYLKDKQAQIYKKVNAAQPGGMPRYAYYPLAASPLWCYASQMSQDLVFQAAHWGNNETRFFVFNYHKEVDIDQMVQYRGAWFTITRVDTADDYNGDMFVYVKSYEGSITPEEYDPSKWGS